MPAYNAGKTIGCAIRSVLAQSYCNWELVIVDDASIDDTASVVRSFKDARIRLYANAVNSGEGASRDVAISNSVGDWIAVLDADDAWESERLSKMISLEPEITGRYILVDNLMQCYEKDGEMIPWEPLWSSNSGLMTKTVLSLCEYLELPRFIITPLFPRERITEYQVKHSELKFGADSEFIIRLLKLANLKIKVYPEPLYLYRLTPGSASSVTNRSLIAKDMLLRLESDLDFTESERVALDYRKSLLDKQNEYMKLLIALREKRYIRAIGLCIAKPSHVYEFFLRLPRTIRYKFELRLKGGIGR